MGELVDPGWGVSAVLGVVLMVAIVVSLGAVTGVSLMQFGGETVADPPRTAIAATFDGRTTGNGQYLNLSVAGGERIATDRLRLAVTGADVRGGGPADVVLAEDPLVAQAGPHLAAGTALSLHAGHFETTDGDAIGSTAHLGLRDATVRLIWTPPGGGESAPARTIWRWEGEG